MGRTFRLSSALISLDLPRLNSPSTTRLNRSSATLVRAAARCRRGVSARRLSASDKSSSSTPSHTRCSSASGRLPAKEARSPSAALRTVGSTGPPQSWISSVEAISGASHIPSEPHRSRPKHSDHGHRLARAEGDEHQASEPMACQPQPAAQRLSLGQRRHRWHHLARDQSSLVGELVDDVELFGDPLGCVDDDREHRDVPAQL